MTLRIYEYDPGEVDEVLAFRNNIFGHVDRARWETMNCTAVVARQEDRLMGFIPLQYRTQVLRPGVQIPVVFENAVGVAEGARGQGIGSQMLDQAAQFMADRVDAMLVIRGGERSTGYRFYRKTGHGDVSYLRHWFADEVEWEEPESSMAREHLARMQAGHLHRAVDAAQVGLRSKVDGCVMLDRERWLSMEPETLALYKQCYGTFGGGQVRTPGYWQRTLDGHVYGARPWHFITCRTPWGALSGYLVATYGTWDASDDLCVYEVVGTDADVVRRLLSFARSLVSNGVYRLPYVSLANPICEILDGMGFAGSESSPYVMARILRPDRIWQRLADGSDLLQTLSLSVSTPHRTVEVNEPPDPRHVVRMETKESLLSRLFCCRLDLETAVQMEMVRWNVRDEGLARELFEVFAPADWVTWMTEYV